jgi:CspA family cold shock protein
MAQGKVKWFNSQKGYGFVEQSEGDDLFVHYKAIEGAGFKNLSEGDVIEYEVAKGAKGDTAINVKIVSQNPASQDQQPQMRRTASSVRKPHGEVGVGRNLDDQLKALRKSSKENQQDLTNRLKRR